MVRLLVFGLGLGLLERGGFRLNAAQDGVPDAFGDGGDQRVTKCLGCRRERMCFGQLAVDLVLGGDLCRVARASERAQELLAQSPREGGGRPRPRAARC